jgi:hypothetical protein
VQGLVQGTHDSETGSLAAGGSQRHSGQVQVEEEPEDASQYLNDNADWQYEIKLYKTNYTYKHQHHMKHHKRDMEADRGICPYYLLIISIGQFRYGMPNTMKIRYNILLPFNLIIY